ncbi:MAG: DUF2177 family protein [Gemmatimonadetes bacterium]|nr:DUF2177 family protein [Gemmatimonadota bacterium]
MKLFALYGLTAAVFFAIDLTWLGLVARGFYRDQLGHFLRTDVLWPAALAFYAVFLVGILVFAVLPALQANSVLRALALGALLGFVAYATFDLTAFALFRDFPGIVVVVDLAWGTVLTSAVAVSGYAIGRWLGLA